MAESIKRVARGLVSLEKKRFKEDGFDLDLTYITPRIIAMGYPTDPNTLESTYRNSRPEVQRFFETRHRDHYKIYNLCYERAYDLTEHFPLVERFPFYDHNTPPLAMLALFMQDVHYWLHGPTSSPLNVIAVHCKAGKGRTGLMIAAYLLHSGVCKTAAEAIAFFGKERTLDGKGLTIQSQMRYVYYWQRLMQQLGSQTLPKTPALDMGVKVKRPPIFQLQHLRIIGVPQFHKHMEWNVQVHCWVQAKDKDGSLKQNDWRLIKVYDHALTPANAAKNSETYRQTYRQRLATIAAAEADDVNATSSSSNSSPRGVHARTARALTAHGAQAHKPTLVPDGAVAFDPDDETNPGGILDFLLPSLPLTADPTAAAGVGAEGAGESAGSVAGSDSTAAAAAAAAAAAGAGAGAGAEDVGGSVIVRGDVRLLFSVREPTKRKIKKTISVYNAPPVAPKDGSSNGGSSSTASEDSRDRSDPDSDPDSEEEAEEEEDLEKGPGSHGHSYGHGASEKTSTGSGGKAEFAFKPAFRLWLHTSFVQRNYLRFSAAHIDKQKSGKLIKSERAAHLYPNNFNLECFLVKLPDQFGPAIDTSRLG